MILARPSARRSVRAPALHHRASDVLATTVVFNSFRPRPIAAWRGGYCYCSLKVQVMPASGMSSASSTAVPLSLLTARSL